MEPIDPQFQSPEPDDAGLDALLAKARWPEPSDASTRRLADAWACISPARRRRSRWWYLATAAAAAVLLASSVVLVIVLRSTQKDTLPRVALPPTPTPTPTTAAPPRKEPRAAPAAAPVLYVADWREPTARERLVMCDGSHRRGGVKNQAQVSPPTNPEGVIAAGPIQQVRKPRPRMVEPARLTTPDPVADDDAALLRLATPESLQAYLARVADVRTRTAALAALDDMSDPPVEALLNELSNRRVALRYAAARALGRINGPATTSALIDLVEQDVRRREAVAALLCCTKSNDAAAYLAAARESRQLGALVRSAALQLEHF